MGGNFRRAVSADELQPVVRAGRSGLRPVSWRRLYDGRQTFSPVDLVGTAGYSIERIEFGAHPVFRRSE